MSKSVNYLPEVKDQYEDYPYPVRDPEMERTTIITTLHEVIDAINHFCFEGKKDFTKGFRALIAGGGTGDATIYLAEQLRNTDAEITHLDLSTASIAVAKKRAEVKQLTNIKFINGSLLDIPTLGLGKFDYINCSGVLHHLKSPDDGLLTLKSALADDGAMGIMVYGKYGRRGIYPMQELMRIINTNACAKQEKVDNTKKIMSQLPADHSYKQTENLFSEGIKFGGDNEIYDMLLHSQDRAYTLPEIFEWIKRCGLTMAKLLEANNMEKIIYSPARYIRDPELLQKINTLSVEDRVSIAELMNGNIIKHNFYLKKTPARAPKPTDPDNVPFFSTFFCEPNIYQTMSEKINNFNGEYLTLQKEVEKLPLIVNNIIKTFFCYLDGNRTIGELSSLVKQEHPQATDEEITKNLLEIYHKFHFFNWMLLRHRSCPNMVKPMSGNQQIDFNKTEMV